MAFARATRSFVAAIGLPLLAGSALLLAQDAPTRRRPTFRAGVEIIHLNVSVTDSTGRHMAGMSERDFAIFEDGVLQRITLFSQADVPISLSLLIDCSASMDENLRAAQAAAIRFIKTLRSHDEAQIVQFNDRVTILQGFTSDQARLEAAILGTRTAGPTALYNALYVALKELRQQGGATELRRRAIVLLSDGEDTASLVSDDQVMQLAQRTEISVYAISLRRDRPSEKARDQYDRAAHFLTALARETGGQVHFPRAVSDIEGVYANISEELRTQYTLGYSPRNAAADGRWRRIMVRTVAREDVRLRHKFGYFAPRG